MFSLLLSSYHPFVRALFDVCAGWLIVYVTRGLWNQFRVASLLKHVPGPKTPSWLWGSEWDVHKAPPGVRYLEWKRQYGDVVKFKGALGRNLLAISDPRAVKYILEEHVFDFPKPQGVREWFRLLVGDGILVVEGKDAHSHQRKMFTPALNQNAIRPLLPTFYNIASLIADAIASKIDNSQNDIIEEDMQRWTNRFSLDTIGLAGFSYEFNSVSNTENKLSSSLESLTNSADNFASFVIKALFFTFPGILKLPSQKARYINSTRKELGKAATDMWNQAKAAGNIEDRTLMSLMMKADGADAMTQEEIATQLRTLVQAGYETVGCELAWIFYEIAKDHNVQKRLRDEVTATPSEPTYDDLLERTPFLDAVIKECLRLHAPVIELTHVAAHDSVVPLAKPLRDAGEVTMVIPRGTIIQIPVDVMQRDPEVWGSDSNQFRPERWLLADNEKHHREVWAFSTGPRKCPGRQFAMIEMKALIAILLRQFEFQLNAEKPIEPFWSFVVRTRVQGNKKSELPLLISKLKYDE
ncbi:cytochrome P450 [Hysterangium stoloniferum]|nr:cytochrome P450 [Hysterangium stoloniferum]